MASFPSWWLWSCEQLHFNRTSVIVGHILLACHGVWELEREFGEGSLYRQLNLPPKTSPPDKRVS